MRYEIIGPLAVSVLMAAPGAHAGVDVGGLDALLKRANFWEERGNDELALVALDKALRLAPDDQNILGRLAIVQLRTLRRTLAAATVARLQALNPQHPALATYASLQKQLGDDAERWRTARAGPFRPRRRSAAHHECAESAATAER